jgi:hypothetical protein
LSWRDPPDKKEVVEFLAKFRHPPEFTMDQSTAEGWPESKEPCGKLMLFDVAMFPVTKSLFVPGLLDEPILTFER